MLQEVVFLQGNQVRKIKGEIIYEDEHKIIVQTLTKKYHISKKFWIKTEEPLNKS